MQITPKVKEILSWYEGESPGVKGNLARLLMHGRLAGTGKLVILPVDQGYEHGPARSFAANPPAYDPHYLYQLAIDAGLSGYAAPLGLLEQGADTYAGQLPTILKINSANSLADGTQDQAVHGSVKDALRLGCVGVGFTIYPGSPACYEMMEELRDITREAKASGLIAVVWSYPRGGKVTKETALDIVAYAAHMAALMGANIIKVKPPTRPISTWRRRRRSTRPRTSTARRWRRGSATSCSAASPASGWWCSRAARPRTPRACLTRSARSGTAAAPARSSAATASGGPRPRRSTCSTR